MRMKKNKTNVRGEDRKKSRLAGFYHVLFFSKELSGVTSKRARAFFNGRISRFFTELSKVISQASTRFFGYIFLTFGLISLAVTLGEYYLGFSSEISMVTVVIGGAFTLLSVPFLIKDRPTNVMLQNFPLTDFILFEFFTVNRVLKNDARIKIPPILGVIVGIIPAVCGYFYSIENVVIIIVAVLFFAVSMVSPEFPILFSLLFLPYLDVVPYSSETLALISVVALISFMRKALVGKRVYAFELHDVILLIFAALLVISSFVDGSYESEKWGWIYVSVLFSYIPLSNMIVNRRLALRVTNAISLSMLPVAIWAIAEYVIAIVRGEHHPSSSILSSPEELCAFLTVGMILATLFAMERGEARGKAAYVTLLGVYAAALITTECVPVLVVLLLCAPAYVIIRSLSMPRELLVIIAFLPCALYFLPDTVLENISSFFFAMPDLVEMKADFLEALRTFKDNLIFGIGTDGITDLGHSTTSNFLVEIACDFGIISAVAFGVMFLLKLRQLSVFSIYRSSSNVSNFIAMGTLSAFALVAFGAFFNIFADISIFYLFFATVAISTASLRISKRDHDDRLGYYGDQRSSDSSAVDVLLRN